jgi:amidase
MPGIISAAGPLANTFRDLRLFMETIITAQPWTHDPTATAVPWTNITFSKPKTLRIGMLPKDSTYRLDPPISRALASATTRLSSAGHTLVPLMGSPSLEKALELAVHYFGLDPAQTAMKNILASGEPMIPSVLATIKMFAHLNQKALTLDDLIELNVELMAYKAAWHAVFKENKIDVVMAPASETTALEHDGYGNCPYTSIWNLLDVSCH